jgi:O-antigen ligase
LLILFFFKNQKMLIPLVLLLALWQVILPEKAIERIKGTTSETGQLDESSELRLVMWERGIDCFKKSPVVGIGYGVFRQMDFGMALHDTHNIYVKILAEQGIIGFILFFVVVFSFIKQGYFLFQKGDDDMARGLGLGFWVSMITLMINNFFGDRWAYFELSAYTWAFAGLVARLSQLSTAEPALVAQTHDKDLKEKTILSKTPGRKPRKSYYK